jgi:sulfate transport system permease protein
VVAGLVFVLLFGRYGSLGPFLAAHGLKTVLLLGVAAGGVLSLLVARVAWPGQPWRWAPVGLASTLLLALAAWLRYRQYPADPGFRVLFATPGLILATAFVTCPFVARELLPVLEAVGPEEEMAAVSLGASGWQMFWKVTLPNIKWGVLYGVILCNARAMGEFGAVYVVSGRVAGSTVTMPLRVEKLFQEYNTPAAFAVASLLTLLALVTLGIKTLLERHTRPLRPALAAPENRNEP